jgi:hypothetical protein
MQRPEVDPQRPLVPSLFSSGGENGAPRPMKMGTSASPWRYDASAHHVLQPANLRRPAILHFASCADGHAEQSRD